MEWEKFILEIDGQPPREITLEEVEQILGVKLVGHTMAKKDEAHNEFRAEQEIIIQQNEGGTC